MHGPGLGYGALELVGVDVVHAHGRADAVLEEGHALLPVAVFYGIRQTLTLHGGKITQLFANINRS